MIKRIWVFAMHVPVSASQMASFLSRIRDLGVSDVALMINSLSDRRFGLPASRGQAVEEVARQLQNLRVDLHLVSWLRPTERYLLEAERQLRPLCQRSGARSLLFDVEEPWTRAPETRGSEGRARAVLERYWRFTSWPCLLGASGITFIPASVKPVAERCDYVLPQAYSVFQKSTSSVYHPGVTQRLAHSRWRGFGKKIVMGLAGWNKLARPGGISESESMRRCLAVTEALHDPQITEVAYWVLEGLHGARSAFVRQAAQRVRQDSGGLQPVSPAPAQPAAVRRLRPTLHRGERGTAVRSLQQRLHNAGIKIAVDGVFGPGTEQAVRAFQARSGLKVDGVAGPATWARLE